jgi:mono/diheme cytochrome c family protein
MKANQRHFPPRANARKMFHPIALVASLALLWGLGYRSTAQTASQTPKPAKAPAGDIEKGRKVFIKDGCYECHGTEAQGGGYTGPRLAPPASPLALLTSQVRRPASEMPPFTKEVLSDQELIDIYAFLQSIPDPPAVETIPILKSPK